MYMNVHSSYGMVWYGHGIQFLFCSQKYSPFRKINQNKLPEMFPLWFIIAFLLLKHFFFSFSFFHLFPSAQLQSRKRGCWTEVKFRRRAVLRFLLRTLLLRIVLPQHVLLIIYEYYANFLESSFPSPFRSLSSDFDDYSNLKWDMRFRLSI